MRVEQIHAEAFGPLRKQELQLAPALTVVHGPNEAGKSSWYAAAYAALCGRRRAKGRGTRHQRVFKQRHKPWKGGGWRVGATVVLDNGTRLRLSHNLNDGSCSLLDVQNQRELRLDELEQLLGHSLTTESTVDGARLLGLDRDSARATIFVGQAQVLRVLQDAGELQEYLQRAATSGSVDTTAEQALVWLADQRRERVGVAHVGSRPLRAASAAVEEARSAADRVRDAYNTLQDVLSQRHRLQGQLDEARAVLSRLEALQKWAEVEELGRRIDQAGQLIAELEERQAPPVEPSLVREVAAALDAYRTRGPEPTPPDGPNSAALAAQLAALPAAPVGDLEPAAEALDALMRLQSANSAFATHLEAGPPADDRTLVPLTADELRAAATSLEARSPPEDRGAVARLAELRSAHQSSMDAHQAKVAAHAVAVAAYRDAQAEYRARLNRYEAERAEYEAAYVAYRERFAAYQAASSQSPRSSPGRSKNRPLMIAGVIALLLGFVLAFAAGPVVGGLVALVGIGLFVGGLVGAGAAPVGEDNTQDEPVSPVEMVPPDPVRPPAATEPGPSPEPPQPPPEIANLQLQVEVSTQVRDRIERERTSVATRLRGLKLPADPGRLREIARGLDSAEDDARRKAAFEARRTELEDRVQKARTEVRALLAARGVESQPDEDTAKAFDRYVGDCRRRSELAAAAARRPDVQEALRVRQDREHAFNQIAQKRAEQSAALVRLSETVGEVAQDPDQAAAHLTTWLERQEARQSAEGDRRERSGRLAQVLDGQTLEELCASRDLLVEEAGPRPEDTPADLQARMEAAIRRRDSLADRVAELGGQVSAMTEAIPPVAEVIEAEAEAERRLEAVQRLAKTMDLAERHLTVAKEKAHANIAPALVKTMGPWLPRVTQGRYVDLNINAEDLVVEVQEAAGAWRDATLLSHGTTEQIYLLLRLSLAEHLATTDEVAPMFLDDVTVQSDPTRTVELLEVLHEVSRHRQIVLFTQESEVVEWADRRLRGAEDAVVELGIAA